MVGKKVVMGVTGLIGIGFVILHSLGNLLGADESRLHQSAFARDSSVVVLVYAAGMLR